MDKILWIMAVVKQSVNIRRASNNYIYYSLICRLQSGKCWKTPSEFSRTSPNGLFFGPTVSISISILICHVFMLHWFMLLFISTHFYVFRNTWHYYLFLHQYTSLTIMRNTIFARRDVLCSHQPAGPFTVDEQVLVF